MSDALLSAFAKIIYWFTVQSIAMFENAVPLDNIYSGYVVLLKPVLNI